MIRLTKLDGTEITVNAEEIETLETSHDTVLTFRSGRKLMVKERSEAIEALVIAYKRRLTQ